MPHFTTPEDPEPNSANGSAELRLRRRIRTKQLVQREALRLFAAKGYDQTTVDDIAHAAAMSSRTFFRYFPAKEDVVLWDEYDERPLREIWQPRPGRDPLTDLVLRIREITADMYRKDPELLLTRTKLSMEIPEIRARFLDQQFKLLGPYLEQLSELIGSPPDDFHLAVTIGAVYSAMLVAMVRWQRGDGREDLLRLFDEAMAALADVDLREVAGAAGADSRPKKTKRKP
jgi:AcrR family transcriptional regulator